jgi:hypothetical protein
VLLNSTSGVLPTARLGGPLSGAWANGKVWLVDANPNADPDPHPHPHPKPSPNPNPSPNPDPDPDPDPDQVWLIDHSIVTPSLGSSDLSLGSSDLSLGSSDLSLGSSDLSLGSSGEGRGLGQLGSTGHQARLFQAPSVYPQVSYLARVRGAMPNAMPSALPLPLYTPAVYSVTLGGGLESDAPFRYVVRVDKPKPLA